jgi:hypothetical protein
MKELICYKRIRSESENVREFVGGLIHLDSFYNFKFKEHVVIR